MAYRGFEPLRNRRRGDIVESVVRRKFRIGLAAAVLILMALVPVFIAEGSVHGLRRRRPDPSYGDWVVRETGAAWKSVSVTAPDGVRLEGWLFTPREPNGGVVMLLHGVNDSRLGMIGHAPYLLRAGYKVLLPDSRNQGVSGGASMSYGIVEAADVHAWADELLRDRAIHRLYGLGASMGGAILIQSLAKEPRFQALVADSTFDTFENVAYYRLERASGLGRWASWPVAQAGFVYVRWRYGVDLTRASPMAAISVTRTPILLIHGLGDINTPPSESEHLHDLNPAATSLWLVPGAVHVSALGTCPEEYARRVLDWFGK